MKKIFKIFKISKKGFVGEGDKSLSWLLLLLPFIIGVALISVSLTSSMRNMFVNENIESAVYEARLLYSPECFAYRDTETGRVYSGILDPNKLTSETLRMCVPLEGTTKQAIGVEVKTSDGELIASIQSSNWGMNSKSVTTSSYFIDIYSFDTKNSKKGIITFLHKEGS